MKRAFFALLIVLVSCQRKAAPMSARSESVALPPPPAPVVAAQNLPSPSAQKPVIASPSRMIIRNANMSLVVRDAVEVLRKISALVDADLAKVTLARTIASVMLTLILHRTDRPLGRRVDR